MATSLNGKSWIVAGTITVIIALLGNGLLVWRDQAVQKDKLNHIDRSLVELKEGLQIVNSRLDRIIYYREGGL